jgi:hypothetical protein
MDSKALEFLKIKDKTQSLLIIKENSMSWSMEVLLLLLLPVVQTLVIMESYYKLVYWPRKPMNKVFIIIIK